MGVKQSKRSVDITETSTKGEIEGFGNEGKVEKLIDGVIEKVAANGHVEGDLQNGVEAHQNGIEPIQNGEAAAVATDKVMEKKEIEEPDAEEGINGQVENGEINGEAEKTDEEVKKSEEKKEKKKEKKDKTVKKKFSFRNFSFSKKDKSKPSKEEKSPGKMNAPGIEEVPVSAEKNEEATSPAQDQTAESPKMEGSDSQATVNITMVTSTTYEKPIPEMKQPLAGSEEPSDMTKPSFDDLPPPLPASPPPSEPIDNKATSESAEQKSLNGIVEVKEVKEVASSFSNILADKMESSAEILKDPEQIAIETGKQIEAKATNLLKAVEERAEESMRTGAELVSQKTEDVMEAVESALGNLKTDVEAPETMKDFPGAEEGEVKKEDAVATIPVEISNLDSLSSKAEDASEKNEESGAGESLADIPKDLAEEVTAASIEATNPDSLEMSETLPPPPVEAPTGE